MPPTIVLVHGAFAESSSWDGVIDQLRDAGHPVIAAANPLRRLATDAVAVADVVRAVDGPVVLAAHSYGGMSGGSETPLAQRTSSESGVAEDRARLAIRAQRTV